MKLLRTCVLICASAATILTTEVARAADYNAEVAFRLFSVTCLRRLANPEDIMEWAKQVRLQPIVDPVELSTFVGTTTSSKKGGAWALPTPNDRKFTLSIRAATQTCAVWAESGNADAAEELFKKMVSANNRPGNKITTDEDQSFTTASGKARLLTMSVADDTGEGYQFTFMASDRPGTFFSGAPVQLSMQMTRVPPTKE